MSPARSYPSATNSTRREASPARRAGRDRDLDPRTVEVLHAWRQHREHEDAEFDRDDPDGHVFARPDGKPTHPQLLSDAFEKLVRRSGLPRVRFHDLRHTHASLLLRAGVPITWWAVQPNMR